MSEREDLIERLEAIGYSHTHESGARALKLDALPLIRELLAENAAQAALLAEARNMVLSMQLASNPFAIDTLHQELIAKLDAALKDDPAVRNNRRVEA